MRNLLSLYLSLVGWVGLGLILGHTLPRTLPQQLGQFLFWFGVPFSIMAFLRQADLSGAVWVAPLIGWIAVLTGMGLAWSWLKFSHDRHLQAKPTQGSFLLAAMVGNTGYLGYPVNLALLGPTYFGWAVFYDTLGSTLAAYGMGVVLAAYFGQQAQPQALVKALFINPAFWSFWIGLALRRVSLPESIEQGLHLGAWAVITLSLILLGMRLSQIRSWQNVRQASLTLTIKMLVVPLVLGAGLAKLGLTGAPLLTVVLQMAMPPAFATLVLAEAYELDRDLTVTTLAMGSVALLLLIPVWLRLFGH